MSKSKCSVPSCSSGCSSDRKKNKQLGVKQKFLFKVPVKDSILRNKWNMALNCQFNDDDVVCETHFKSNDIIRDDVVTLTNGKKHFTPRDKPKLSIDAIPSKSSNSVPTNVVVNTFSVAKVEPLADVELQESHLQSFPITKLKEEQKLESERKISRKSSRLSNKTFDNMSHEPQMLKTTFDTNSGHEQNGVRSSQRIKASKKKILNNLSQSNEEFQQINFDSSGSLNNLVFVATEPNLVQNFEGTQEGEVSNDFCEVTTENDPLKEPNFEKNIQNQIKPSKAKRERCTCSFCRQGLKNKSDKKKHSCDMPGCSRTFSKGSHLKSHLLKHNNIRPYKCDRCDKSFLRSDELARHMRTHTGEKPYNCLICVKKFSRSDHLKKHIKTHSRKMSKNLGRVPIINHKQKKNPICANNETFNKDTSNECLEEMNRIEIKQENYGIDYPKIKIELDDDDDDSISSIGKTNLAEIYTNDVEDNNYWNDSIINVQDMMKIENEKVEDANHYDSSLEKKRHSCEMPGCTRTFSKKCYLKSHLFKHNNIRSYKCDRCDKSFHRSDGLCRHMRTHTGEKTYNCHICVKKFSRSDHLKKHLNTHSRKKSNNSKRGKVINHKQKMDPISANNETFKDSTNECLEEINCIKQENDMDYPKIKMELQDGDDLNIDKKNLEEFKKYTNDIEDNSHWANSIINVQDMIKIENVKKEIEDVNHYHSSIEMFGIIKNIKTEFDQN